MLFPSEVYLSSNHVDPLQSVNRSRPDPFTSWPASSVATHGSSLTCDKHAYHHRPASQQARQRHQRNCVCSSSPALRSQYAVVLGQLKCVVPRYWRVKSSYLRTHVGPHRCGKVTVASMFARGGKMHEMVLWRVIESAFERESESVGPGGHGCC